MQKGSEAADTTNNQTENSMHHDTDGATVQAKDNKEKKHDTVQDEAKDIERTPADRRNEQNNDVYVEKDVMQSLAGSLFRSNNKAIVTDKNALTVKQSVYKKRRTSCF